jgi:RNA polymerase primary sigma factor
MVMSILPEEEEIFTEEEPTEEQLAALTVDEPQDEELKVGGVVPDSIRLYLSEIGKYPRLTPQEEVDLAKMIERPQSITLELARGDIDKEKRERLTRMLERAESRFEQARNRFITANLRLVVHYSYKYVGRGVGLLDLIQEGNLGLIRAVEKFDWRTGFRFSTYATWWIKQALKKVTNNQERQIRLPVHANDDLSNIIKTENMLQQELQRSATEAEVATGTGLTAQRIAHLKAITKPTAGLDDRIDGRGGDGDITYADTISDDEHLRIEAAAENDALRVVLLHSIKTLTVREGLVIILRNGLVSGHPLTLAQTGEEIGVSREMARQIEIKALAKMRQEDSLVELHEPE